MKKVGFVGFIVLLFGCLLFRPSVFEAQNSYDVPIDSEHFPDQVFSEYIQTNFDLDKDSILSKNELDQATTIFFKENMYGATNPADTVQSLQGIEYFYNLSSLSLYGHEYLSRVDLSQNNRLEKLIFLYGDLLEIKLPTSSSLKEIDLFGNSLSKLDLSNCKNLTKLCLDMNGFEKIDLSKLTKLKHLTLANNYLSSIDLSNNTNLEYLELEHNKLKTVDLSNNTALQSLDISGNNIEKFDAKNFNQLFEIFSDESTDVTVYYSSTNDKNSTTNFKGYCTPNVSIELHNDFTYDSEGNIVVDLSKILSPNLLMNFWDLQDDFDNDTYYPTSLTIPLNEFNDKFIKTYTFEVNSSKKEWTFYLKDPSTTETSTLSTNSTEPSSSTPPSSSSIEESSSTKPSSSSVEESSTTKPPSSNTEESSSTKPSSSSMEPNSSADSSSSGTEPSSSTNPASPEVDYHTIEVPSLTLPKYADFKQAIKDKMVIKDSKGKVVPTDDVEYTITNKGNTDKIGKMSAVVSINYPNGVSMNTLVRITVISGIEINQPDIGLLFNVGSRPESFDPYSVFRAYEIGLDGSKTKLGKYDGNKKVGIEVIENPVDFSKTGNYTVRYRITNSLGEVVEHSYVVTVQALNVLTITAEDKVMYVGDLLTEDIILSWAKAENASKLQFELLGKTIPVNLTTNTLSATGEYFIRYIAYQDAGNVAETTIKLTVKDRPIVNQPVITSMQKNLSTSTPYKESASTPTSKTSLPKTGSGQTNYIVSLIGFFLIGIVGFINKRNV